MITDSEITTLMSDQDVLEGTLTLKKDFLKQETQFAHLSDDEFVSLVFMAPAVGVALANGSVSLYEHMTLNNKARRLSHNHYFLRRAPVMRALDFLLDNFQTWEDRFYNLIRLVMHASLKKNKFIYDTLRSSEATTGHFKTDLLNAPYIFIKFLSFLFLEEADDLLGDRRISKVEHEKIFEIGVKLDIDKIPLFQAFWESFDVQES